MEDIFHPEAFTTNDVTVEPIVSRAPLYRTFMSFDVELSYIVWGDESKPPIVLLHGGKDHNRNWDWTVAELIEDYCLYALDLRGHGNSGRLPGVFSTGDLMVADLANFITHLEEKGIKTPMHFIGHSLGGNLVLNYAAIAPEKVLSVIAMEGLGASQEFYEQHMQQPIAERLGKWVEKIRQKALKPPRRFDNTEVMVERMLKVHKNLSPAQGRHLALHATRKYKDGWGWKHHPHIGFFPPVRMTPVAEYSQLYGAIECPVLLMRGEDSWASDPVKDGRIEAFKNAVYKGYPNAGHWLHHDAFEAYILDVKEFLSVNG